MALDFDSIKKQVMEIIGKLKQIRKFDLLGIIRLILDVTGDLVELVEEIHKGAKGEDKKKLVVDGVRYIYKEINPDIPWIVEPFETMLENFMLDKLVPVAIDFIVDKFNEKGIFTHSGQS